MGEKRYFLIKWPDGIAVMVTQPIADYPAVKIEYDKRSKSYSGLEICETIYG